MDLQTHRTPLRRVSRGSLTALSRSGNFPDAPPGLGFMGPALENLADENEALQANLKGLQALARGLEEFNEAFASYLYVQKVNAYCVEWHKAPVEASFDLARRREEEAAAQAAAALASRRVTASAISQHADTTAVAPEKTMMVDEVTFALSEAQQSALLLGNKAKPKRKGKAKMTAKEKKERNAILEKVCSVLPLEFRGSDPKLRRQVEHVIESLMDAAGGLKILDMVKGDINQAKVNKCLIALVNRKVVQKASSPIGVVYTWQGVPP